MTLFNLSTVEPRFAIFLAILRKLHVNVAFLEALKEALAYLEILGEHLSQKGRFEEAMTIPIGEVCNTVLQRHRLSCRIHAVSPSFVQ